MKTVLKQVAGIDVAQKELVVTLGRLTEDLNVELYAYRVFTNSLKGFKELIQWTEKLCGAGSSVRYVMEATGVYHEPLAYHLDEQGRELSVVLPSKISNYARTLAVKTITDKTASETLARFGLERKLDRWKRPDELYRKLRQLTRERSQLMEEMGVLKNQMHAEKSEAHPNKKSIERMQKRLKLLQAQEQEIMQEVRQLIKTKEEVRQLVVLLCSIPGVGLLTAVTVLGETDGFDLIRNKRQLTCYCGLDVKDHQSGTSVKGKPRISKKGNRYLRKAMHFPALTAIKHDQNYKALYERLRSRHGIKMKAAVAVQRKLLEMTYTVFKTSTPYKKDFQNTTNKQNATNKQALEDATPNK